ncbi:MAG: hypothetical protein K2X03_21305 [Bryobacteraceae bacterium]|nr:hypothetical protein [Bryobacteraceae bacterium]
MSQAFQLGLRYGLVIGILTLVDVYAGTMTNVSRTYWMFAQTVLGLVTMYICGWAGMKAFDGKLAHSAVAGGLAGLIGTMLFTFTLFTVCYGLTDQLRQFPFSSVDLAKTGQTVPAYVRSADGVRDLWNVVVSGMLRAPLGAGFGAIGGLIARSAGMIPKS